MEGECGKGDRGSVIGGQLSVVGMYRGFLNPPIDGYRLSGISGEGIEKPKNSRLLKVII